MAAPDQ
jgi:NAD(P)-dependent dehydrogenase (short-subunit alcohol dehydrogenase family)